MPAACEKISTGSDVLWNTSDGGLATTRLETGVDKVVIRALLGWNGGYSAILLAFQLDDSLFQGVKEKFRLIS
jgi:hypothetical protein